jgi:putative glycosyltransferase (TIGR04348 family)
LSANNGNARTAARWMRMLRAAGLRVRVQTEWDGCKCDVMIALHAGRSAASIAAFADRHPHKPLIVVLTGTDLYGGLEADARRSLALATRLVVLNELGIAALPRSVRHKAEVILQSARPLTALPPRQRSFDVAVVGHLRAVKDPRLPMRVACRLPESSRIRILHVGQALDQAWSRAARATARSTERYRWLDGQPPGAARGVIRRARLLLHPSRNEGGAIVVIEALQSGTPVIASDCAGNVGLLGHGYPGLFPVGDAQGALSLLLRAEREPRFLQRLTVATKQRARLTTPAREASALRRLVHNSMRAAASR